jgi:hypothetical protein
MLTADGRAPPFGDLAKCATAAVADAGAMIQRSGRVLYLVADAARFAKFAHK